MSILKERFKSFPIKLQRSKTRGRFAIAEKNLEPGDIVLEEVPTAFVVLKYIAELPGIAGAASVDYNLLRLLLCIIVHRHYEQTTDFKYQQTEYEILNSLVSHHKSFDSKFKDAVHIACQDLQDSFYKNDFTTINVEDMVKLACRINSNSHAIQDPEGITNSEIGVGMFPLVAMLNHSCAPNAVFVSSHGGKMVVRVVKPVLAGDEICVSYVDLFAPKWERQGKLLTSKFFWCECSRCNYVGGSVDPDLFIDSLLCEQCRNTLDDGYCQSCCKEYGSDYAQGVIAKIGVEDAMDLFKAGMFDSAVIALLQCLATAERLLHPDHYLILTICINLESLYSRLHQFTKSILYSKRAIDVMTRIAQNSGLGENLPELSNLYEKYSQLLEICAEGAKEGLIVGEYSATQFKEMANNARTLCYNIRKVCFGKESIITQAVSE
ncbi:hypothetical protein HDV04_003496 [Boothiomyces sp. JEL0838]|nr:hypothetical protein HDV04_003496 [Boothiomyces sp. JEL0838]